MMFDFVWKILDTFSFQQEIHANLLFPEYS